MKYKSINQLDKFYFRDAALQECKYADNQMTLKMTGVVARYNHPSNETLTDRYIDQTQVRIKGAVITKFFLEGAKYYDANDVLQKEVPDTDILPEEYEKVFPLFQNSVVFWVKDKEASVRDRFCCEIGIDVTNEKTDTYWMEVEYEKAVTEWEHFLNKAMLE